MKTTLRRVVLVFAVALLPALGAETPEVLLDKELSPVARQLLSYKWSDVKARPDFHSNILYKANYWLDKAMSEEFRPIPRDAAISFHAREQDSCDAIRFEYKRSGYEIVVAQTRWCLSVVIEGNKTHFADLRNVETVVRELAEQLFPKAPPFVLMQTNSLPRIALGLNRQTYSHEQMLQGGFFIKEWWSDGKKVGFFGLKVPENLTGMSVTPSIDSNRIWWDSPGRIRPKLQP